MMIMTMSMIRTAKIRLSLKVNHLARKESDTIGTSFSMITTSKTFILWKSATDIKLYRIYMVMRMQTRCMIIYRVSQG